jgi:hypothetical protein
LEAIRGALAEDGRWARGRVSSLPPDLEGSQLLLIWVTTELPPEEAEMEVRASVYDLVTNVIPAASLRRVDPET